MGELAYGTHTVQGEVGISFEGGWVEERIAEEMVCCSGSSTPARETSLAKQKGHVMILL